MTLADIAKEAGVSRMTISKALRGASGVSEKTRSRIREIAKKMGYTPDPNIATAMSAIARTRYSPNDERLAFLTAHETPDGWKKYPHITNCYRGASTRAQELGYQLEPFWALELGKQLADVLYARGIDGILLAPTGTDLIKGGRRTIEFDWSRTSVVEIDEQLDEPHFRIVRHDHFSGILEALFQMESLGYRRIGLALKRTTEALNRHRWSSAYLLWSKTRFPDKEIPIFLYDDHESSDITKWTKRNALDSVIGLPQAFLMLTQAGIKCPKELGFALLDHQAIPGKKISCSGIYQNSEEIGAAAIDLLVGLIHVGDKGPPVNPLKLLCKGCWVKGNTTRRVGPKLSDYSLYDSDLPF